MKKLRMDLEQLVVDTFDTVAPVARKGTVFGEQCTCYTACTCPGCPTCVNTECNQNSCAETCATCDWSCGGSCMYTECTGNTFDARTCDMSANPRTCCPA
jgi:hypothetical protein